MTISSKEDYSEKAEADFKKVTGSTSPKLLPNFVAKAAASAKSRIPGGYGDGRTTTLTAEVKPEPNTIPFELSDASAPPEPPKDTAAKGRGRKGP